MKRLLSQLLILAIFIASAFSFYLAIKVAFFSSFINIMFVIVAIFLLIVACGEMDKLHGFGKYSGSTESESESKSPPIPPPHNPHDNNSAPDKH